ncbi:MAG: metalloregulator ArsR/SmtB family transcription factor [Phenylobacterium sp.]
MQGGRTPAAILDALGDPTRRLIFARLRREPSNVTILAKGLPVTRSAVSRHLQVLKGVGLVAAQAQGTQQVYRATPEGLGPLAEWIADARAAP